MPIQLVNLLNLTGFFTSLQVSYSKIVHGDCIVFMCFVRLSEQTVTLPYTSLTDWLL